MQELVSTIFKINRTMQELNTILQHKNFSNEYKRAYCKRTIRLLQGIKRTSHKQFGVDISSEHIDYKVDGNIEWIKIYITL